MNKSVYFPDDAKTKQILERVEFLRKSYKVSFSELVLSGLTHLVKTKKPAKNKDFRNPTLSGIRP